MNKMNNAVGAACIVMLLAAVQASACGDSLFRSGFGVNIPVVKVEHAANIVIFTPTKHDVFFDDAKVAARLDKTGHKVTVVHETAETGTGDARRLRHRSGARRRFRDRPADDGSAGRQFRVRAGARRLREEQRRNVDPVGKRTTATDPEGTEAGPGYGSD